MTWTEARQAWLKHQALRGLSPRTLEGRDFWTSHFEAFCLGQGVSNLKQVTASVLARYQQALKTTPAERSGKLMARATVDGALGSVRIFLRWAVAQGVLLVDPTADLVIRRGPLPQRTVLAPADIDTLMGAPDTTSLLGLRDRALLELYYGVGIRRRECYELNVDDVDLAAGTLLVREGKGAKERLLPLGDRLCQVLSEYVVQSRSKLSRSPDRAGFLPGHDRQAHGLRTAWGPGSTSWPAAPSAARWDRMPCATPLPAHLLEGGADVREVQELLGHGHIQSTEVYTHLRDAERRDAYRQTHPRARWSPPPQDAHDEG